MELEAGKVAESPRKRRLYDGKLANAAGERHLLDFLPALVRPVVWFPELSSPDAGGWKLVVWKPEA